MVMYQYTLMLLHSERPKLYTILDFLSAIGLNEILSHLVALIYNMELNNLRMIICLRKSDFGVEKFQFVMSMKNLLSMAYTVMLQYQWRTDQSSL